MNCGGRVKNFSGPAPYHHQARRSRGFPELPDILHQHFRLVHFRTTGFDIWSVQPLHVVLVEHSLHRLNRFQRLANFFEQRRLQNIGIGSGLIGVIVENVPAPEYQVLNLGQWNKVLNARRPAVGTLAQPDRSQLRE